MAFPSGKYRGTTSPNAATALAGGYASVVSQKRGGAVFMAASQETVKPSSPSRMTVSELDTIGYRRFSGALMSQGLGTDPCGPSRSLDPDG